MAPSTFELATYRIHARSAAASAMSVERHKQQKNTAVEMNNIFIYGKNVAGNNKLLVTIRGKNALLLYGSEQCPSV